MKIDFNFLYIPLLGKTQKTKIDENISAIIKDDNLRIYIDDILVFEWYIYGSKPIYYYKIPKKAIKIINDWTKNVIKQIADDEKKTRKNSIQNHINTLYK